MEVADYNLIISVITLLSNVILHFKFRHFHSLCCSSDCAKSQPNTPSTTRTTSKVSLLT